MRVDLFDFDLPEERIALRPAEPRDAARLLVVRPGGEPVFEDAAIGALARYLAPGDALVVNDARVIPARLYGLRTRGEAVARIEATLHKREAADRWRAFVRPAKKLKLGERIRFGEAGESISCLLGALDAQVVEKNDDGEVVLAFDFAGPALDEAIDRFGAMPLPPYIASRRAGDLRDAADYQTMFAQVPGAVAAPTAGLHFTPALTEGLARRGISLHRVTLHVGAGTFLPVKAQDTANHRMHTEIAVLDAGTAAALNETRRRGGRLVSVGTTSLRVLESAADEGGILRAFAGDTSLFITPGYRFRA
ncbi:MAG TPA: tRNA preQ1(34) S-adenosylmethionine ribosyltransferase-isomerase QueA, partial [Beijerinckiaceae bacterium]|nr:tRNA preQ1(34) S-adenosylmethionine ribosyltransferase-isomerase QueA [Beijerinckiaceae bacterium]